MAITVTSRGTYTGSGNGDHVFSPSSNFTANSFAIIAIGNRNTNATQDNFTSIVDSLSNTWTFRENVSGVPPSMRAYTCASQSLTTGSTITINFTGANATTAIAIMLYEATSNVGGVEYSSSGSASGASSPTITSGTIENGNAIIGFVCRNSSAAPGAPDSDTTNGSWSTAVDLTNTNCTLSHQNKIVTADGTQTYNITSAASYVIIYIEAIEVLTQSSFDPLGTLGIFGI